MSSEDSALVPGRARRHDESVVAMRRKRMLEEDDVEILTPKAVREAYVPRRHVAHIGADLRPAVFEMPSAVSTRLAERASPNARHKCAPHLFSPKDMERLQNAAQQMRYTLPYAMDEPLALPSSFQQLVAFHRAVEHALLVHMATHGAPAAEPCTSSPRRRVIIPSVLTYQRLRGMVERTCRRTFDVTDFRRLVWVWSHAPGMKDADTEHTGGMGFLVTRTRSFDVHTRRKKYDWGVGIEMSLCRPTESSLHVQFGSPLNGVSPRKSDIQRSPPRTPDRKEMSHLAIWNAGIDERRAEFTYRLTQLVGAAHAQWAHEHGKNLDSCVEALPPSTHTALTNVLMTPPAVPSTPKRKTKAMPSTPFGTGTLDSGLLTPAATRATDGHTKRIVPSISALSPPSSPLATRSHPAAPSTPPSTTHKQAALASPATPGHGRSPTLHRLVRWHPEFAVESMPPIPLARLPPLAASVNSIPIKAVDAEEKLSIFPASAPSQSMSLEERIRAKEQAIRTSHLPSSKAKLQERSILSRLGEMANTIFLLYTSLPTTNNARGHRTSILPMNDVLTSLENSASVSMSRSESKACIDKLMHIAPGWLEICMVGTQTWVRLHNDPKSGCTLRDVRDKIQRAMAHM